MHEDKKKIICKNYRKNSKHFKIKYKRQWITAMFEEFHLIIKTKQILFLKKKKLFLDKLTRYMDNIEI